MLSSVDIVFCKLPEQSFCEAPATWRKLHPHRNKPTAATGKHKLQKISRHCSFEIHCPWRHTINAWSSEFFDPKCPLASYLPVLAGRTTTCKVTSLTPHHHKIQTGYNFVGTINGQSCNIHRQKAAEQSTCFFVCMYSTLPKAGSMTKLFFPSKLEAGCCRNLAEAGTHHVCQKKMLLIYLQKGQLALLIMYREDSSYFRSI